MIIPTPHKVAVIGAGWAGLVSARELKREGHRVTVFEKNPTIGGTWAYDPRVDSELLGLNPAREIVSSSMYKSLRVNLPRHIMGLLDYPFVRKESGDPRNFPGHEEVLLFLLDLARDSGLVELIRVGCDVIRVERVDGRNDRWEVEWRTRVGESEEELGMEVFEAVVVCNGKHTEPKIANFPGRDIWPGLQLHSHNYRTPELFQDQVVIVIGNGPSARDIIKEISPIAKQVHQANRSHSNTQQSPDSETRSNISKHSMISKVYEDGKVEFQDGTSIYADVIIHCTGYKYHIPFLKTNGIVTVDDNRIGPLYQHVFPPSLAPWLSFVGLPNRSPPALLIELQAKWVAKALSGVAPLPTEEDMELWVEELYKNMDKTGWPKHHTHKLQQDKYEYEDWLVGQLGLPPLEKWREVMFFSMSKITATYGEKYRDLWDVDKWIQEVESAHSS